MIENSQTDLIGGSVLAIDLMSILAAESVGVFCLGRDWRVTYANANARSIGGLKPDRLNSISHWKLSSAIVGVDMERELHRAMEEGTGSESEFFYKPADLWVGVRILPIETGIALIVRDITARKIEEENLLSTVQQMKQVLESTTDGVFYLDPGYNFIFLNHVAEELLAPEMDLIGTNIWARFPFANCEGSQYLECYRRTMEEGIPSEFESYYPEPLNKWFCVQVRPAKNGIVVFFRDITQMRSDIEDVRLKQERSEHQRMEIESFYRTAPVGLALFDPIEFRYVRVNDRQAAFFGLLPEQLLGQPANFTTPYIGIMEAFERVAQGEAVHDRLLEGEPTSPPSLRRYWTVNWDPVFAADGSVQAISAATMEITKQKCAEAALIQSEKLAAVGRLSLSISHEINNPLASVVSLLYLIAMDDNLSGPTRKHVMLAQEQMNRVSELTTQTLLLQRQSTRYTSIKAMQLLSSVLDLYEGRLLRSNIAVETRYASQRLILCSESEIRQVINNLIANAIDAMPRGGRLVVRSHDVVHHATGRPGVRLTIADTGEGMSKATVARIFEAFYTTKELNGSGLGLWISSGIVEKHGGSLRLRSSQGLTNHGTVFSFFLPSERRV